jgi:DNA mismatch repair protein MutS2
MEDMMEKEKVELEKAKTILKEMKEKTEVEAKKILADTNKIIEKTVRTIKESQAEKEKTKEARQELTKFKEKILKPNTEEEEKIQRKIEKLREREGRVKPKEKKIEKLIDKKPTREKQFTIGMPVKIKGQTSIGEIMELSPKNAVVAFGNLLTTVGVERLEALDNQEKKNLRKKSGGSNFNQSFDLNQRRLKFKPGLDVRGKRADEALRMVTDFIDEAIMVGAFEVKILHGTGSGILRQLIREYLSTVAVVQKTQDEHIEFGGAGITVVNLG